MDILTDPLNLQTKKCSTSQELCQDVSFIHILYAVSMPIFQQHYSIMKPEKGYSLASNDDW